jgi:glycosyltransferase involved in cell wall biosynthesis
MSSGLAVVGKATGVSREILEDEVNALVFPKEDAEACSSQILRLMDGLKLLESIRQNGRKTIEERFSFEYMIEKIEDSLQGVVTRDLRLL